jgi:hypothetical protein
MQVAREFGESRDAKVNRLSDEIHTDRGEITRAGRRPQAIGADAVRGTDPAGEFFKRVVKVPDMTYDLWIDMCRRLVVACLAGWKPPKIVVCGCR